MGRHPLWLLPALALTGCLEPTLSQSSQPPVAKIQQPGEGASYPAGDPVEFLGRVADEGPVEDLQITWLDNGETMFGGEPIAPDADGFVSFTTSDLLVGSHAITLRVVDAQNLSHEDSVEIEILVPDVEPTISITQPTNGAFGEAGTEFVFEAQVSDPQDAPEELLVDLVSDLDGNVCTLLADEDGVALCRASLFTEGNHRLTFTVTDLDGNTARQTTLFRVDPVPEEPSITIVQPTSGTAILENTFIELEAEVSDRQDAPSALLVSVVSDVEGSVCPMTVSPQGIAECTGSLSQMGNQYLTFTVTDTDGNAVSSTVLVNVTDSSGIDDDGDGQSENQGDCNDANTTIYSGAPELPDTLDNDCDGFFDEGTILADDDNDGYCESTAQPCTDGADPGDCDDAAVFVNPSAPEVCGDGVDNNCSGTQDEAGAQGCQQYYYDGDGDGFGDDSQASQCLCNPAGPYTSLNGNDCDDLLPGVYPGQPELPNGSDDDCDGTVDEGTALYDDDGDGFCESTGLPCSDGSTVGDCDDGAFLVSPNGTEVCNNGLDDDCDGQQNEVGSVGCTTFYLDNDGDGYGSDATATCACSAPAGNTTVTVGGDCNDNNASRYPGANEVPNGQDDDCDGVFDEGTNRYDNDGDGYCAAQSCTAQPGQPAPTGNDCNDANSAINPGANEVCFNGQDDNCNNATNEGLNADGCTTFYADNDGDGYGGDSSACYCNPTGIYDVQNTEDCYDFNQYAYPGQSFVFTSPRGDGSFDYNCDGVESKVWTDEAVCAGQILFISCGSSPGWGDDVPDCGEQGFWVDYCAYNGNFGGFLACTDLDVFSAPTLNGSTAFQECN